MPVLNLNHIDFGILGLPAGEHIQFEETGAIYVISSGDGTPGNGGTMVVPAAEENPNLRSIRLATREIMGGQFEKTTDVFQMWSHNGKSLREIHDTFKHKVLQSKGMYKKMRFMETSLLVSMDNFKPVLKEKIDKEKKEKGCESGIYKLHCLNDSETEIEQMTRCLGTDEEGVIYIGKAKKLLSRVMALRNSFFQKGNKRAHICGRRYLNPAHVKFTLMYPVDRLFVTLYFDKEPEKREAEELYEYCRKFGETPPLNSMEQASLE